LFCEEAVCGYKFSELPTYSVLQKAARKNNVPVDASSIEFNIASSEKKISPSIAKEAVFVNGLYFEGAG
jgi:hypothetical protein